MNAITLNSPQFASSQVSRPFVYQSNSMMLHSNQDNETKLNKQDPYQVLQNLIINQETGKLIVQNPLDEFVNWHIYLGNGKIHFANSSVGARERLGYLLGHYVKEQRIKLPEPLTDDYQYLCQLWNNKIFSFQQTRSILSQCTQEALVQVLSLPKTFCEFDPKGRLEHLFLNLDLDQIIVPIKHKIRYWWELRSEINSPFQRPLVEDWDKFNSHLAQQKTEGYHQLKHFNQCLENLSCLYTIAGRTQMSTLQLGLMLRPLIKAGEIKMLSYQDIQIDNRPLIACVDNRPAIQRVVKFTLENSGFRTISIEDPFNALAVLMSQKPSLVLINVDLPDVNGYQLCSLCRKSTSLKDIPIIMLMENDSIINRVKTKLAGASGYIQKPFLPNEMVQLIRDCLARIPFQSSTSLALN